jgi:hypothetical protein
VFSLFLPPICYSHYVLVFYVCDKIPPVIYFLQFNPTSESFHHLSIIPSNCKSISKLIHQLNHSSHDHLSVIGPTSGGPSLQHMSLWGTIHVQIITPHYTLSPCHSFGKLQLLRLPVMYFWSSAMGIFSTESVK